MSGRIAARVPIVAVSDKDVTLYNEKFNALSIQTLPVFVPWTEVRLQEGIGTYCLYHGNLSVAENETAVLWLLENVFNDLNVPFVIAGKNPSEKLVAAANNGRHCCLIANPADDEMRDLIAKAQINVLPSFNETGIKLKLLNALFNGRHCIVNDAAVDQTGLESACHVVNAANEYKEKITGLYHQYFGKPETEMRQHILGRTYNNSNNAKRLIALIWPHCPQPSPSLS